MSVCVWETEGMGQWLTLSLSDLQHQSFFITFLITCRCARVLLFFSGFFFLVLFFSLSTDCQSGSAVPPTKLKKWRNYYGFLHKISFTYAASHAETLLLHKPWIPDAIMFGDSIWFICFISFVWYIYIYANYISSSELKFVHITIGFCLEIDLNSVASNRTQREFRHHFTNTSKNIKL